MAQRQVEPQAKGSKMVNGADVPAMKSVPRLRFAEAHDLMAMKTLFRNEGDGNVYPRADELFLRAIVDRRSLVISDGDEIVATASWFPMTRNVNDLPLADASSSELSLSETRFGAQTFSSAALFENAHMCAARKVRGSDYAQLLHGARTTLMTVQGEPLPPVWLLTYDNKTQARVLTDMGAEKPWYVPDCIRTGLWPRAEKVRAMRQAAIQDDLPSVVDPLDWVQIFALRPKRVRQVMRQTAGALALLGDQIEIDPAIAMWLDFERLERIARGTVKAAWYDSDLVREMFDQPYEPA